MDLRSYKLEAARILAEAARLGLMDSWCVVKPGKPLRDLRNAGNCQVLLDRLVESDLNHRQWMAVGQLRPEIEAVVTCIRVMERQEARLQPQIHLAGLRSRVYAPQRRELYVRDRAMAEIQHGSRSLST